MALSPIGLVLCGDDYYSRIYIVNKSIPVQSGCLPTLVFVTIAVTVFLLIGEYSKVDGIQSRLLGYFIVFIFVVIGLIVKDEIQEKLRSGAPAAESIINQDKRTPILYLRPFLTDSDTHDKFNIAESIGGLNPWFWITKAIYKKPSFESDIAMQVHQLGPFIGLNASGYSPSLGSSKLTTTVDEWKSTIRDYIAKSQIIVSRIGETPGLKWEIEQIIEANKLESVILFVRFPGPQDKELIEVRYRKFSKFFYSLSGATMPKYSKKLRFIYFSGGEGKGAKSIGAAMLGLGKQVETSSFRGYLKGAFKGAGNPDRKPDVRIENKSNLFRVTLFLLLTIGVYGMFGVTHGFMTLKFEDMPGTLNLLFFFLTSIFAGVIYGQGSVKLNISGEYLHFTMGLILILWAWYLYYVVLFQSWEFMTEYALIGGEYASDFWLAQIVAIFAYIWAPFTTFIYGWSKAEKNRCYAGKR